MTDSRDNPVMKKTQCWPARIVGIIGVFFILWFGVYAVQDFPSDPKMIPVVVLWAIMLIGALLAFIKANSTGGLVMLAAGGAVLLFVLVWLVLGWDGEGAVAAAAGTFPLFLSGLMFTLCRRRRN